MNKTELIEGHPYISVGKTHKSRQKNTQYAPKRINKNMIFDHQYRPKQTHTRSKSKTKTKISF